MVLIVRDMLEAGATEAPKRRAIPVSHRGGGAAVRGVAAMEPGGQRDRGRVTRAGESPASATSSTFRTERYPEGRTCRSNRDRYPGTDSRENVGRSVGCAIS